MIEVEFLLDSLDLSQYTDSFEQHHVDVALLPDLTHDTLKAVGATYIGHRNRSLKVVSLRQKIPTTVLAWLYWKMGLMIGKRATKEEIIQVLNDAEDIDNVRDACRKHNITVQTFYRWCKSMAEWMCPKRSD